MTRTGHGGRTAKWFTILDEMTHSPRRHRRIRSSCSDAPLAGSPARRARGDRGVAMVEFAFVMILLFTLIFGIIHFGYLFAFKSSMTQAVNDGARQAAVVEDDTSTVEDEREEAARDGLDTETGAFDKSCTDIPDTSDGLTCSVSIAPCDPLVPAGAECLTAELDFDNTGDNQLLPAPPLIGGLIPDTLTATAVVEVT
jgi:Flp pilus assembly protein TadG